MPQLRLYILLAALLATADVLYLFSNHAPSAAPTAPSFGMFTRSSNGSKSPSTLTLSVSDVDLSTCYPSQRRTFRTSVHNVSSHLCSIIAMPSCGCTDVRVAKTELAPGDATDLTGTLSVSTVPGPFSKSIRVFDRDSPSGGCLLRVHGIVNQPICHSSVVDFHPDTIRCGTAFGELLLTNSTDSPVTITAVPTLPKGVRCDTPLPQVIMPARSITVLFTTDQSPIHPPSTCILETSHPLQSTIRTELKLSLCDLINVSPPAITLTFRDPSELKDKTLDVVLNGSAVNGIIVTPVSVPAFVSRVALHVRNTDQLILRCSLDVPPNTTALNGVLILAVEHSGSRCALSVPFVVRLENGLPSATCASRASSFPDLPYSTTPLRR